MEWMHNEIYYRIVEYEGKLTVVCMQWFDEHDYNEDRFMIDEYGDRLKFEYKKDAIQWLFDNVKEELIDEEYVNVNKEPKFNRDYWLK